MSKPDNITITMSRKDARDWIAYMRYWGKDFMCPWTKQLRDQLVKKLKTPKRRIRKD
jgi:hypothetical protein